jgi:hypothetical protein
MKSFNLAVLVVLAASATLTFASANTAYATTIQLNLTVTPTGTNGGTWSVSATDLGGDNKGITGFDIDVIGFGGVVIGKASPAAQTVQAPNPPFSQLAESGKLVSTNLNGISAFQNTPGALSSRDDSELVYQEGIGTPFPLAKGVYTGPLADFGGITVQPEISLGLPAITVFPLNYDVDDVDASGNLLPGNTGVIAQVRNYTVVVVINGPEPASFVLLGLAGIGLAIAIRSLKIRGR